MLTPDEIQRLMSGYATGSLTEGERNLLFEAALEDQHVFDQLAQEEALKELIDQPGARDRLIAALAPAETSRAIGAWKKPLAWGLAAMFVVSMSVAALMLTRSGIRTQVAQKRIAEPQIAQTPTAQTPIAQTENAPLSQPSASPASPAPGSAVPSVPGSATPPPAKQERGGRGELDAAVRARPIAPASVKPKAADRKRVAAGNSESVITAQENRPANSGANSSSGSSSGNESLRTATVSPAAAPPPPPPAQPQVQTVGQISPPVVQPQGFVAGQPQGVPQPAPTPQAAQLTTGQLSSPQTQGRQDSIGPVQNARNQAQTGPNQVQSAGGGGGRGAGVGGAAGAIPGRAARLSPLAPARFAFDYSIDGEDLVFKFSADGYFSLHIAPGGLTIVDSRVAAGSTRREHITTNGTEAVIVFAASPQSDAQGVSMETRARSLTVEDPARKRIEVLVKFY